MTNIEKKITRLSQLWVRWNLKEITGDDFAVAFRNEFHLETQRVWDEKTNLEKIVKEKIENNHRVRLAGRIRREMVARDA